MLRPLLISALLLSGLSPAFAAGTTPAPAAATAAAPLSKATHDDALALVQIVLGPKVPEITRSITNGFMGNLQQRHPELPNDTYEAVRQKVVTIVDDPQTIKGLQESLVQLFAKYYSDAELKQIIAFSKTSAGTKLFTGAPPQPEVTGVMRSWAEGTLIPQLNQATQPIIDAASKTPAG